MSFTGTACYAGRSIDLVMRSLLQHDSLPFSHALTVEQIQQAFDEEGVSFGGADSDHASSAPTEEPRST